MAGFFTDDVPIKAIWNPAKFNVLHDFAMEM